MAPLPGPPLPGPPCLGQRPCPPAARRASPPCTRSGLAWRRCSSSRRGVSITAARPPARPPLGRTCPPTKLQTAPGLSESGGARQARQQNTGAPRAPHARAAPHAFRHILQVHEPAAPISGPVAGFTAAAAIVLAGEAMAHLPAWGRVERTPARRRRVTAPGTETVPGASCAAIHARGTVNGAPDETGPRWRRATARPTPVPVVCRH